MQIRLEKINPFKRQRRYYVLDISLTLFDEWCLIRKWGRIGTAGGQVKVDYLPSRSAAEAAMERLKAVKNKRGYATIPVQLELFQT